MYEGGEDLAALASWVAVAEGVGDAGDSVEADRVAFGFPVDAALLLERLLVPQLAPSRRSGAVLERVSSEAWASLASHKL